MLLSILNDPVRASTEEHRARVAAIELPAPPPESAEAILAEVTAVRAAVGRIRVVISAYPETLGPIKGGPLTYTLDSADPEKLKAIVDDMQRRTHEPLAKLLPSTLILGHNYATDRLKSVYSKFELDATQNFIDVDETRAILYQLALGNKDLKPWLDNPPNPEASHLAAFLAAQIEAGRDKITLLLPEAWASVAGWTRRAFTGLHLITGEKPNLRHLGKDRVFLVIQRKGEQHPEAAAIKALRNANFPIAAITFNATAQLSRYMRFMEDTAFTLKHPTEDPRPSITDEIFREGVANNAAWKQLHASPESPRSLANAIGYGAKTHAFTSGEIAFFGDLRYSENAPLLRKALDNAARLLFRSPLKMPATVCEAPSGMLLDRSDRFSILIAPAAQNRFALAQYEPDRHIAEFLATKLALENQRRQARAILVKDQSIESIAVLEEFFSQAAKYISSEPNGQIQSR